MEDIFKAYDIRGKVGQQLNPKNVEKIAKIFSNWLPTNGVIAVGYDMRPDSARLAESFIKGAIEQGCDVWDLGLITSDMVYFAVGKWNLSGGAVITASHNPGDDNGIKLYRDNVVAVGINAGLDKIRDQFLENKIPNKSSKPGRVIKKDILNDWVNHCLSFIDKLSPYKIAIDTGNGMAGAILPSILPKLPLSVHRMYFELDGTFPNHEANPQKIENLQDLIEVVVSKKLDFGIAFDGDGDRAVFVDDKGRPVNGSDLLTIIAKHYLKKYPKSKIVHDVRASKATQELIEKWGGTPIRTKAGRVNIGSKMRKVGAPFGGECTGHMFFKENYDADSGLITALVAMQEISESQKKLSELVNDYRLYCMPHEINIESVADKNEIFNSLSNEFKSYKQDRLDGLTVWLDSGWFNLRASNTEPILRLNAEANTSNEVNNLIDKITSVIKKAS